MAKIFHFLGSVRTSKLPDGLEDNTEYIMSYPESIRFKIESYENLADVYTRNSSAFSASELIEELNKDRSKWGIVPQDRK